MGKKKENKNTMKIKNILNLFKPKYGLLCSSLFGNTELLRREWHIQVMFNWKRNYLLNIKGS